MAPIPCNWDELSLRNNALKHGGSFVSATSFVYVINKPINMPIYWFMVDVYMIL